MKFENLDKSQNAVEAMYLLTPENEEEVEFLSYLYEKLMKDNKWNSSCVFFHGKTLRIDKPLKGEGDV